MLSGFVLVVIVCCFGQFLVELAQFRRELYCVQEVLLSAALELAELAGITCKVIELVFEAALGVD